MRHVEARSEVGQWGAHSTWQDLDRLRWAALLALSAGLIASVLVMNKSTELSIASAALTGSDSFLTSMRMSGPTVTDATKVGTASGNGQISPPSISLDWDTVNKAATTHHVQLVSASNRAIGGTANASESAELTLTLRGRYADLKAMLAELLDHASHPVMRRMEMRRLPDGTDVEAQLILLKAKSARVTAQ